MCDDYLATRRQPVEVEELPTLADSLGGGKVKPKGKTITPLSGRNIDMQLRQKIINQQSYEL